MAVAQLRLLQNCALHLSEDSPLRDEIPEFAHIVLIERSLLITGKKSDPSFREKSRGPGGAVIRIGSTRRMNAACRGEWSDHQLPCRSERSPTGIKQSPVQSSDRCARVL